jgi:hypothetical protein
MAWWLRPLVALEEDLGSVASSEASIIPVLEDQMLLLISSDSKHACGAHGYIQAECVCV